MSGTFKRGRARRLGLESLEGRRLMAGDAGSTIDTAADLGIIVGTQSLPGSLSYFDTSDWMRIELTSNRQVDFTLQPQRYDANLLVADASGNVLARSQQPGTARDRISGELSAGVYYVGVEANSWWRNSYRLTLSAQPIVVAPPVVPPVVPPATPPIPTTPSGSTPTGSGTTIAPLADVAYYGSARDWSLNAIGAPESWAAGYLGQGVTVAVVDTGVDLDHPDLMSQLFVNPGEIAGNGVDDDANGFIDDVSGWDFVSRDAVADDVNGHGTHVAGTIAANRNGSGATGVAPGAKILPVRVLGNDGSGSTLDVAAGIRYAANMGAQIINLSLGGGYSQSIASAISYARSLGSLIIAAAGNESASVPGWPAQFSATMDNVLSVGAFDSTDRVAGFSNLVGGSRSVQVDAPGVGISNAFSNGRIASLSGTSMAAPQVAGLAALALSANPRLTSKQLRDLITAGVVGAATGSDSIGKIHASTTVAYAAAGLTTVANRANTTSTSNSNSNNATTYRTTSFIVEELVIAPETQSVRQNDQDDEESDWEELIALLALTRN